MFEASRREFLKHLAAVTGGVVLSPVVTACQGHGTPETPSPEGSSGGETAQADGSAVPFAKPTDWDPIAFNRARGNAGAIPDSYLESINGPDGEQKHLGKHLPYRPALDTSMVPAGFIALMWGDPSVGHAKHPNAVRSEANNHEGHWYNWIRVRKATSDEAEELQSAYSEWPQIGEGDNGAYAVFGGDDITADDGKNTVYLAALPADVSPGDTIRIHAHCLTHGEYVDFMTV